MISFSSGLLFIGFLFEGGPVLESVWAMAIAMAMKNLRIVRGKQVNFAIFNAA
ncbi:hypothetical protein [Bacillus smithii]|uniref:hypothetical protein n=1 Tax=Bacillus smithii TaxID=1479 RepID=UPI0030C9749D